MNGFTNNRIPSILQRWQKQDHSFTPPSVKPETSHPFAVESIYGGPEALKRFVDAAHKRGLRGQSLNFHHVNNNDKVVAFHRWDQGGNGDDVIVVCNFKNQQWNDYRIGLPSDGVWKVRFNSDWNGYSSDFGNFYTPDVTGENSAYDGMNFSGIIRIPPYSTLILSKD